MKISKSIRTWRESCFSLFQTMLALLTFDYFGVEWGWKFVFPQQFGLPFASKLRNCVWWFYFLPEELVEVLTLGYLTLERE